MREEPRFRPGSYIADMPDGSVREYKPGTALGHTSEGVEHQVLIWRYLGEHKDPRLDGVSGPWVAECSYCEWERPGCSSHAAAKREGWLHGESSHPDIWPYGDAGQ